MKNSAQNQNCFWNERSVCGWINPGYSCFTIKSKSALPQYARENCFVLKVLISVIHLSQEVWEEDFPPWSSLCWSAPPSPWWARPCSPPSPPAHRWPPSLPPETDSCLGLALVNQPRQPLLAQQLEGLLGKAGNFGWSGGRLTVASAGAGAVASVACTDFVAWKVPDVAFGASGFEASGASSSRDRPRSYSQPFGALHVTGWIWAMLGVRRRRKPSRSSPYAGRTPTED